MQEKWHNFNKQLYAVIATACFTKYLTDGDYMYGIIGLVAIVVWALRVHFFED